jgi:hypothetical protein
MKSILSLLILAGASQLNAASVFLTSPTSGGVLPSGVSVVGGIVADFIGLNGARLVSQLSASSLFVGSSAGNPLTIGTQTGFTSPLLAALGGGFAQAAFRITLYDGDTATGNFDYLQNSLLVNGMLIQDFSAVTTTSHNSLGTPTGLTTGGFPDGILSTGFFFTSDPVALASIHAQALGTGNLIFGLLDVDPGENYFDFKQGIDSSFVNAGAPPSVAPPSSVPEPSGILALGFLLASGSMIRVRNSRVRPTV